MRSALRSDKYNAQSDEAGSRLVRIPFDIRKRLSRPAAMGRLWPARRSARRTARKSMILLYKVFRVSAD
jgi:hypothetical protein